MDENNDIWPKSITVDKNIVSVLSQSTYQNFPRALKELITNSYDADAKSVTIDIDLDTETVVIEDTGRGMSDKDFEFYLRIAGKTRRKEDNLTPLGRPIIGQFGVGFLSVFPFFRNYSIESKRAGTSTKLHATIPLFKYFSDQSKFVDVSSILINGGRVQDFSQSTRSFTKITLTGFNDLTKSFFYPRKQKTNRVDNSSVDNFDAIRKLQWILSDDLPIKFEDDRFNTMFDLHSNIPFEVHVNGEQLFRKVYGNEILETHKEPYNQIGKIKFKYAILTSRKSVKPYEARYLKVRNLNVGVGDKRENFSSSHGATRSRFHWLTGEVHIIEGMNELIKVSRDDFNFSTDYEELKDFLSRRLNYFSNRLEDEADIIREIKQTGKEFRVNNLSLLNPVNIQKKLQKLEEEGFDLKTESDNSKGVVINEENKEVIVSENLSSLEKHIIIKNKKYLVKSEHWDFKTSLFPACKLQDDTIIINSSYPLFTSKKFTDVFVKMHLMLLFNHRENKITEDVYLLLINEILEYYSDYK
ncbi:ATP-binding protein [Daejeonella lutea]|uniref:ATP-binding protein n=1 Tax=Daejeonella lutea TaxID=572036 RepID=UPI001483A602|nr:ATP-binding protein [Daejeonella lutea]